KPVEKTMHVSLVQSFIPGPSSGVRGMAAPNYCMLCQAAYRRDRQDPLNPRMYSVKEAYSYAFVALRAQSWVLQDHILCDSDICGMDDDYVSALACLRDTIPSFDFSCFTNKDTAPSKAQQTKTSALFSEMVKDMKVHFDMIVRHKAIFECLRAPHAQNFLLAIPIDDLGQHMHVWIPLGNTRFIVNNSQASSTDMIRPADVLVFRRVKGKHACVDLTEVYPLVGLSSHDFTMGQAALKVASCKVTEHNKACIENQHVFIPFAFDTFGFLAPEGVELLNRVLRVLNRNVMTPRSTNVFFHRIRFTIQKGLATQLVARLSSTTM
nr:putative reverse transcriptase domain-containing protein [Tanacetum cinerariifolium]